MLKSESELILFASDLHLSPDHPEISELFFRFISGPCQGAQAIYWLGDIFETWVGDDHACPFNQQIELAFLKLVQSGKKLYFMQGNRDFLVQKAFATRTGCQLIPDPTLIDLFGRKTLLMHGDMLCTLDRGYQRFRTIVHHPWIQTIFLTLPLKIRNRIFKHFRGISRKAVSQKPVDIMDVNPETVREVFSNTQATQIIHGHVHRPRIHEAEFSEYTRRYVLGDWQAQHATFVQATPEKLELVSFK